MTKTLKKVRRTWALDPRQYDELEAVKKATATKSDTLALGEAIHISAQVTSKDLPLQDVLEAITLWKKANMPFQEAIDAISLWKEVKRQVEGGASLVFENKKNPSERTMVFVPRLG